MSWKVETLMQGYPGKSRYHGGLGWSTVALARDNAGHVVILDTGGQSARRLLPAHLEARGVALGDITDVLMTHLHYDHCRRVNIMRLSGGWR